MYKYNDIENKIINRFKYLNLKSIEVENNINLINSNKKIKEYDTEKIYKEVSNYYLGLMFPYFKPITFKKFHHVKI